MVFAYIHKIYFDHIYSPFPSAFMPLLVVVWFSNFEIEWKLIPKSLRWKEDNQVFRVSLGLQEASVGYMRPSQNEQN